MHACVFSNRSGSSERTQARPRRGFWLLLTGLAALTLIGCEPGFVYVPASSPVHTHTGQLAAHYSIPPEAPCGDLRVASAGYTRLPREGVDVDDHLPDVRPRALHVRLTATNDSTDVWTIDARVQRVDFEGYGLIAPSYLAVDDVGRPRGVVRVRPGLTRNLDLYFPIPEELEDEEEGAIPPFAAVWEVNTGKARVRQRTMFERYRAESLDEYAALRGEGARVWDHARFRTAMGGACDNPYVAR